ncbi:MAG TPA: hypothetical protein VJH04_00165 [archaeon]|nr:hypothetical protein [archaeon]
MKWMAVPEANRVKVTKDFKAFILNLKDDMSWDEFEKISGTSKHMLQDYIYGKQRYQPTVKTLKEIGRRFLISPEVIQNMIVWDKDLENLSRDEFGLVDSVVELEREKHIDMTKLCKYMKITGQTRSFFFPLKLKIVNKDFVEFSYASKNCQFNPNPIRMKRYVPFDERLFQVFGLIQAEGSKYEKNLAFVFTNSSPNTIKFVLDYFRETWCINEGWKCDVTAWNYNSKENELEAFWAKILNIPENNIKIRKGPTYRLSKTASELGVCQLRLFNKTFNSIIMKLLEEIKTFVENNDSYTGHYLTGIFSGDGAIATHNGKFRYIGLAFNQKSEELDHYHKVLKRCGITFDKEIIRKNNRRCIIFKNWRVYYKILQITNGKLFLDKTKNDLFINGVLENQYFKPLLRLNRLKGGIITAKLYSEMFNVTTRSSLDCLARLVDLNLLSINQERPHVFAMTDEGYKLIKFIEKLER